MGSIGWAPRVTARRGSEEAPARWNMLVEVVNPSANLRPRIPLWVLDFVLILDSNGTSMSPFACQGLPPAENHFGSAPQPRQTSGFEAQHFGQPKIWRRSSVG